MQEVPSWLTSSSMAASGRLAGGSVVIRNSTGSARVSADGLVVMVVVVGVA